MSNITAANTPTASAGIDEWLDPVAAPARLDPRPDS